MPKKHPVDFRRRAGSLVRSGQVGAGRAGRRGGGTARTAASARPGYLPGRCPGWAMSRSAACTPGSPPGSLRASSMRSRARPARCPRWSSRWECPSHGDAPGGGDGEDQPVVAHVHRPGHRCGAPRRRRPARHRGAPVTPGAARVSAGAGPGRGDRHQRGVPRRDPRRHARGSDRYRQLARHDPRPSHGHPGQAAPVLGPARPPRADRGPGVDAPHPADLQAGPPLRRARRSPRPDPGRRCRAGGRVGDQGDRHPAARHPAPALGSPPSGTSSRPRCGPPTCLNRPGRSRTLKAWKTEIRTFCLTRVTNARTEAAKLNAKNIERAGRGHGNYRARILLTAHPR